MGSAFPPRDLAVFSAFFEGRTVYLQDVFSLLFSPYPPGHVSRMPGPRNAIPMTVKVGDRVLIGKYTGQDIKINDEEHTIVREDEILGIIE